LKQRNQIREKNPRAICEKPFPICVETSVVPKHISKTFNFWVYDKPDLQLLKLTQQETDETGYNAILVTYCKK
jgi:hypothetical protein